MHDLKYSTLKAFRRTSAAVYEERLEKIHHATADTDEKLLQYIQDIQMTRANLNALCEGLRDANRQLINQAASNKVERLRYSQEEKQAHNILVSQQPSILTASRDDGCSRFENLTLVTPALLDQLIQDFEGLNADIDGKCRSDSNSTKMITLR